MTNKELSIIKQKAFLEGREYERKLNNVEQAKKKIAEFGRTFLKRFPPERKPDDGNGDEFNAGYNEARKEIGDILIDIYLTKRI